MNKQGNPPGPGWLARWVPAASWLPRYQRGWLAGSLAARNVPLGLAHVHGPALEMAERSGLLATVGADRVFPTTPAAVTWARSVADAPGLGRPASPGSG